jgi:prepilin-type N-terminal cleavage/methylation domain-containing protein
MKRGFSLIELLVVMTILGIVIALAFPASNMVLNWSRKAEAMSNMRQAMVATMLFANDNYGALPGRAYGNDEEGRPRLKWPAAIGEYLGNAKILAVPGEENRPVDEILSNTRNQTAFMINGFNDLGGYNNPTLMVNITLIETPANVILFGRKKEGVGQYYMDFVEGPNGNQNDVLDKEAYGNGSIYGFADGSGRYLTVDEYQDEMWLINRDYQIPSF